MKNGLELDAFEVGVGTWLACSVFMLNRPLTLDSLIPATPISKGELGDNIKMRLMLCGSSIGATAWSP